MEYALGQGVAVIFHSRHVLGATISFLAERWSGARCDEFFELRDHVMAEGSPCLAIGEFLHAPTLEGLGSYAARLVELDEGVRDEVLLASSCPALGAPKVTYGLP